MPVYIYWTSYLFIINLAAMVATIADKHKAKKHLWRISESVLLSLATLGGSPAMLLTMLAIHHKTRHTKFMLGIPVIIILQIIAIFFILKIKR